MVSIDLPGVNGDDIMGLFVAAIFGFTIMVILGIDISGLLFAAIIALVLMVVCNPSPRPRPAAAYYRLG